MDRQMTRKMKPVHHISLLSKDTLLPEQVRGVRGCSLIPQPWARTHRRPCRAAPLMESPQSLQGNSRSA